MELIVAFLTSRLGQIALVAIVSYGLGWARTDHSWRVWEANQQKIRDYNHQVELAREAENAVEIAKAATERVEEDTVTLSNLQKQVADFDKGEADAKDPCLMDDRMVGASQRLRFVPKPRRPAKVTRPPK